jgi:hypothetical protein
LQIGCPLDGVDLIGHLVQMPLTALNPAVEARRTGGRGQVFSFAELFRTAKAHCSVEIAECRVCDQGVPVVAENCSAWGRHLVATGLLPRAGFGCSSTCTAQGSTHQDLPTCEQELCTALALGSFA